MIRIITGDCLDVLPTLPAESVQCCVTSPPYWGLRDYGVDGQLGLEKTPEEYVDKLVAIFRQVRRVLRGDGVVWLNLGDSYNAGREGGHAGGTHGVSRPEIAPKRSGVNAPNLKPKDLCGIPWRVAFALQADGWWLRSDIIWHKPNCMPESVTDRPTKAHEYVFLLSKSARYFYDADAVREPFTENEVGWLSSGSGQTCYGLSGVAVPGGDKQPTSTLGGRPVSNGRNRRTVWTISTFPFPSVVSYGSYRIASPDCQVHDYPAGLAHVRQYGEQLVAFPSGYNPGTDAGPAQGQEGVVVSIPLDRFESHADASAAMLHNIQKSRTVSESERDVIFYGISNARTGYKRLLDHYAATFDHNRENKTSVGVASDELGNHPSEQKTYRIVGIETYESPPVDCSCYYTGKPQRSQDHFAVFPPALVEPCIRSGSSQAGCCPECGAAWERVVERERHWHREKREGRVRYGGRPHDSRNDGRATVKTTTTGWQPTCTCFGHFEDVDDGEDWITEETGKRRTKRVYVPDDSQPDPIPCTTLDPFGGAGTVGLVADRLGRDAILIELSPDYAEMARQRIVGDAPMLVDVRMEQPPERHGGREI